LNQTEARIGVTVTSDVEEKGEKEIHMERMAKASRENMPISHG